MEEAMGRLTNDTGRALAQLLEFRFRLYGLQ